MNNRAIPASLKGTYDPGYEWETAPGLPMPFYKGRCPLFSKKLLMAIIESGVDNLELFPIVVSDNKRNIEFDNYVAVNIVGLITCADKKKSKMMGISENDPVFQDHFSKLYINPAKTDGVLMFRAKEAINAIIVHEKVRQSIEKHKIPWMHFYGPGEWAG